MANAHKFIDYYIELDQLLAKALNQADYVSFRDKVRDLSTRYAVIKRYRDDLFQLENLRNTISQKT